ncbi:DEAD/DEAH box helicase [Natronobacterium gregoryi]|uniref:ERCC4-like helicase n=2 Tax=Natronobacterium gregoryi TaxID=44930 RepID=L0AGF1_NATGS|nr:DEAD/DEAH box helicase [Natronobacterium gregoryi]AFZ72901.1 ERCC4-like helicase [Natronobacterium gregoryi SP2]ELY69802.1 Hef nuclease [Natronobacterium gregoryi SP2]PLK21870.1 Hef nuclease [Natronobacterium gregoryi SP2]SFI66809.1 fanconi anemia group M protein [Natronobacterium gregoryi]
MAGTDEDIPSIEHPLLEPDFLERRLYQLKLAGTAADHHTLVCLPTGLGKTTVSLLVTARRLEEVGGKSLMLAPTKPLVQQHADFYREALQIPDEQIVVFTGDVSPEDRAATWEEATVVMATPQVIENDLVGSRVSLADVTHCTFDECHRATGDYAYNYIAERYHADAKQPLVTGMSASPGGDEETILEVCENLGIEEVEVMTEEDADVSEFTHDTDVEWERIDLPEEVLEIRDALNDVIKDRLEKLKEMGIADSTQPDQSQKELNAMRAELQKLINNDQSEGFEGMSIHAEVMKLRQAVTLVETQSVEAVRRYFDRQRNQARSSGASKASQRLVSDPRVREAMRKGEEFDQLHPKYRKTRMILAETLGLEDGERVIVFTESRDTAEALTDFLSESFEAKRFVGQGDREGSDGMTQNEQQEVLDDFRAGEFEVLISTSVAEEGLDVPEVDLVLFYEPVPTAIRSIQRKGRTGRQSEGRVVVLMAEDTRDEAYFWISRRREQEMEDELRELKGMADELEEELDDSQQSLADFESGAEVNDDGDDPGAVPDSSSGSEGVADPGLQEFDEGVDADDPAVETHEPSTADDGIEVVADQREMDANIARDLSKRDGIEVRLETLEVGDYVLSDRVIVERKSVADFVDSLVGGDRSMFEQVGAMARHYSRPIVIVEGEGLYEQRDIHPNAVRGALSSLAVDFDASVLRTESEERTTELLAVIAGREQETSDREVSVHGEKQSKTLAEQQEYVVSSIAEIGPVTARSLLEEFGTVEAVMIASEDELQGANGVGQVTAERMREVIGSEYTGST